jgi:hypothetical protein
MPWRMRCRVKACQKRFSVKRHPNLYVRWPKCPACGTRLHTSLVEAERQAEMDRAKARGDVCGCSGYSFPHRRGSIAGCVEHPDRLAGLPMTEDELRHHAAVEQTPRGAASPVRQKDPLLLGTPVARTVRNAPEPPF